MYLNLIEPKEILKNFSSISQLHVIIIFAAL